MDALIQQYRELAEAQFYIYRGQLRDQIPIISTTTYVLTVLAVCIPPIILLIFYEREQARLRAEQPKGCRKLGMNIESNLLNEFDKKFSEGRPPSTEETSAEWWRLKSMWIYPVKSCRGVELNRGTVIATGMEYDRQFTFAQLKRPEPVNAPAADKTKSDHKWEFITQRQFPLLAKIRTEMWVPDQSVDTYVPHAEDVESGGVIILSFPYQEPGWRGMVAKWGAAVKGTIPEKHFRIPFDPSPVQIEKAGYSYEEMTIWKDRVKGLNMELDIPEDLRYFLGISNKLGLFRVDNSKLREVHRNAPTEQDLGYQPVTGFQDAVRIFSLSVLSLLTAIAVSPPSCEFSLNPRCREQNAASQRSSTPVCSPLPRKSHHHWPRSLQRGNLAPNQNRLLRIRCVLQDRPMQNAQRRPSYGRATPF
jgi:hypothetical protein